MDKAAVVTTYSASATGVAAGLTISHWVGIASVAIALFTAGFNVWWKLKTMEKDSICECKR